MGCYALIVGVCQDWPEQRLERGDIGLARCLAADCNLPKQNVAEVYDGSAARSNVLRALDGLLDRRNERRTRDEEGGEEDTLLVHYGGHGKRTEFCTPKQSIVDGAVRREPWIQHSDIVDLLERKFQGGTALCFIDCCHAGGFGEAVVRRRNETKALHVKYGCIMSVPPASEAGDEWTMTECLIRTFRGELRCHDDASRCCYYLSTKKGKHKIQPRMNSVVSLGWGDSPDAVTDAAAFHPTWGQVLEYLSDEMTRLKGDRLTTLFFGEGMQDGKFLSQPCAFGESRRASATNASASIPRDATWMEPFLRTSLAANDEVWVKLAGAESTGDSSLVGWFPGRIVSLWGESAIEDAGAAARANGHQSNSPPSNATIELYDHITKDSWTTTVPLRKCTLLGGLPFGFGFDPEDCTKVIAHLAKSLAFYDTSLPPNIEVKVWSDGKHHNAKTLGRVEVPWNEVDLDSELDLKGPCVPLLWEDDSTISFEPTEACIVRNDKDPSKKTLLSELSTGAADESISTPMGAMLASLNCRGMQIQPDDPSHILDNDVKDAALLEAYDAEDKVWSAVQVLPLKPQGTPLSVLAYHICYPEAESLSVAYWESDESLSVIPNSYLRSKGSDSDDNSSDEESYDEATELEKVSKYVRKMSMRHSPEMPHERQERQQPKTCCPTL
ncbi:hypothetical protein ACHAXT_007475 [Thalassiosira profunda]